MASLINKSCERFLMLTDKITAAHHILSNPCRTA